jgi:hypothetical protein
VRLFDTKNGIDLRGRLGYLDESRRRSEVARREIAKQNYSFLEVIAMCRNIKILFNFDPPVTAEEIRNASLQFVRKISGFNKPSHANEASFEAAVDDIAEISARLLHSLKTNSTPRNREEEAARAKARSVQRFGA